jgi:hypothetical protein
MGNKWLVYVPLNRHYKWDDDDGHRPRNEIIIKPRKGERELYVYLYRMMKCAKNCGDFIILSRTHCDLLKSVFPALFIVVKFFVINFANNNNNVSTHRTGRREREILTVHNIKLLNFHRQRGI